MCVYLNNRKTLIQKDSYSPVFIAALFIITKVSKQPKDLLMDKWIKKTWDTHTHTHIHTHTGILVSHGKNEILLFVTTGMDLEGLSEHKSDGEKQILYDFIHMWNKKKPRQTDKTKTKSEGKEVGGREKWVKRSAVWWWTVRLEVTSFVYTNVQLQWYTPETTSLPLSS